MPLKDVVCNSSLLEKMLIVEGGAANKTDLQTQLCDLPAEVLKEAESLFFSQIDLTKFIAVSAGVIDAVLKNRNPTSIQFTIHSFHIKLHFT